MSIVSRHSQPLAALCASAFLLSACADVVWRVVLWTRTAEN
jgi:hypothetical protein